MAAAPVAVVVVVVVVVIPRAFQRAKAQEKVVVYEGAPDSQKMQAGTQAKIRV